MLVRYQDLNPSLPNGSRQCQPLGYAAAQSGHTSLKTDILNVSTQEYSEISPIISILVVCFISFRVLLGGRNWCAGLGSYLPWLINILQIQLRLSAQRRTQEKNRNLPPLRPSKALNSASSFFKFKDIGFTLNWSCLLFSFVCIFLSRFTCLLVYIIKCQAISRDVIVCAQGIVKCQIYFMERLSTS